MGRFFRSVFPRCRLNYTPLGRGGVLSVSAEPGIIVVYIRQAGVYPERMFGFGTKDGGSGTPRPVVLRLFRVLACLACLSGASTLAAQADDSGVVSVSAGETVELASDALFDLPPTVVAETNMGDIPMELTPGRAPGTVENFLRYVETGRYADSFIHRSAVLGDGSPFVIQGGGFFFEDPDDAQSVAAIPTFDPIPNEPNVSNTRGTVAMAKLGGDPDSATSQWFVNLGDNGDILDEQNGGFTVFGRVVGDGMTTVDAIAALERANVNPPEGGPFGEVPLQGEELEPANFVLIDQVARVFPELGPVSFPEGGDGYFDIEYSDGVLAVSVSSDTPPGDYRLRIEGNTLSGLSDTVERTLAVEEGADPWFADAGELDDGWRFFEWFKGFKPAEGGWIYHGRHGWLFVNADSPAGLFLWDVALNRWLWTSDSVYPWMYAFGADEGWFFFFEGGSPGARFFQAAESGEVIPGTDLRLP